MMKSLRYLCTLLLMLFVGVGGVKAQEEIEVYKTGFESSDGFGSGSSYNNTTIAYYGPDNKKWGTYYGTVSTTKPLNGSQSIQNRFYKNSSVEPYAMMNFDVENVSSISFKSKVSNQNLSLLLQYSEDEGKTWKDANTFVITTNGDSYSHIFENSLDKVRFKFIVKHKATHTNSSAQEFRLDDVSIKGTSDNHTSVTLSFPAPSYSVNLGDAFNTPALTVEPADAASEVVFSSSNTDVATVGNNGSITVKAIGETTITASINDSETYENASTSYTLTVSKAPLVVNPKNVNSNYFVKVTNVSDLEDGDAILIVNGDASKAMSTTQNTNNRAASDIIIAGDIIDAPTNAVQRLILVKEGNFFYFYAGELGYLYAASSSGNYLKTGTDCNDNYKAAITITGNNATIAFQGSNTRNLLKYNSSSTLFSCYASGQQDVQIYKEVVKPVVAITAPTFSVEGGTYFGAQSVELTCETEDATIYYTTDGTDPTAVSTPYTGAICISETTTLKAIAIKGENASVVASAEYKIVITTGKGVEDNPFTVADARKILDAGLTLTGVYVRGTVSEIITPYNSQYGNISYNISDDGTTTTDQLLAFRGKSYNGEFFSSESDIQVKDAVVVKGDLILYNTTYELAADNQLVSLVRPEKLETGLAFESNAVTAVRGEAFTAPELTNPNDLTVVYSSSNEAVAMVDAETGAVSLLKAGETVISASYAGDADYKAGEASYTLTVTVPNHNATFFVNGQQQGEPATVAEDEAITFPTVAEEILGKIFVGWTTTEIAESTNDEPATLVNAATMGNADVTYYAVFANVTAGTATSTVDELTREWTGVEEKETYGDWSDKKATSDAVYAGQSAGDKNSIQLRSKNSNSGVVSTFSGGRLKKVAVVWNDETTVGRTLNVYGSNTAYTAATELYGNDAVGTLLGTIVKGTSTELAIDGDYDYVGLRSKEGAMYLTSISVTWENGTPDNYSGYCTTLTLAAPTFSVAAGEVEKGTEVTISAEEGATLKYTVGEVAMTSESNTATVAINEDVTIKAVAVKDGVESEEVSATYTVKAEEPVEEAQPAEIAAGFYTIKNLGNKQFVNVAGRKTATLVDNAEGMAGTVIQVESDADGIVKTLRSQGVDVPGYATRAMKYVPDVVKLVVEKLHVSGSGEILGETGVDKILDKFNKSVDVNLHVVHADGGYRIYGKTPSMTPVKEFYQENKANVDAKLPGLEQAINDAIATIVDKVGKGESLKNTFKLDTIWKRMGWTGYEPGTEETTQVAFLQQVLANEENIWNFAYQTAMFYMEWVEGKQAFQEMQDKAPELMKYWNLAKKVRPNFMYYIVQKDGKVDVISQGNEAILNNDKSTVWALEEVSEFKVNLTTSVEKTAYPTTGGEAEPYTEYYGTLYTDFAYQLPEGVTAYKVTGINKVGDKAYVKKAELNSEVVPAQTPVLLIANTGELTLTIAEGGEAVADNQLYGNDYLINEYDINTPQLEGVFNLLAQLSQSTYDKYEYLMRKNAGTVNNKYFFGIAVEGELNEAYYAKTGKEMGSSPVLKLGLTDGKVGFFETWDNLAGNEGFMFSEEVKEILMNVVGDVNRDGKISVADVNALVEIVLGKATYPADADKYDFEAADVNTDKTITISDVTALVNMIIK